MTLTAIFGLLVVLLSYYGIKGWKASGSYIPSGFSRNKMLALLITIIVIFVSRTVYDFLSIFTDFNLDIESGFTLKNCLSLFHFFQYFPSTYFSKVIVFLMFAIWEIVPITFFVIFFWQV